MMMMMIMMMIMRIVSLYLGNGRWTISSVQNSLPSILLPVVLKTATKPDPDKESKSGVHIKHNFKTMSDGRLLISGMEDDEEDKKKSVKSKGVKIKQESGGIDDLEDMMDEEFAKVSGHYEITFLRATIAK